MKSLGKVLIRTIGLCIAFMMLLPDDADAARRRVYQDSSSYDNGGEDEEATYSRKRRRRTGTPAADSPMLVALGGGVMKPFGSIGEPFTAGYGGMLFFQYNRIVEGFGVELKGGYLYLPDKKYSSASMQMAPVIISPMYSFDLGDIAVLQLKIGGGFAWVQTSISGMGGLVNTRGSSLDPLVAGGMGIHFPIAGRVAVGIDACYYYLFESRGAHGLQGTFYVGMMF